MRNLTLSEHLQRSKALSSFPLLGAHAEFTSLMHELIVATKIIQNQVALAGLVGALGSTGQTNVQGEKVQKLDDFANSVLLQRLQNSGSLYAIGSEEEDNIIIYEKEQRGSFIIYFDPLDGSSNIDVNVSIGTIFSIYKISEDKKDSDLPLSSLIPSGAEQVCSGYALYGPSAVFVYTLGDNVHAFTYDASIGEYLLSHENIQMPESGEYYSVNVGNEQNWDTKTQEAVKYFNTSGYSMRYVGSLVADFHRTLLKGGVYLYPQDTKNKDGKLRLVYEANPLAFIAEQAGGMATNGTKRILDIKPDNVHTRTPLVIGSKKEVSKIQNILN